MFDYDARRNIAGHFFLESTDFFMFYSIFSGKNEKKIKKNEKNCKKICIYQKKVVILHRHSKKE